MYERRSGHIFDMDVTFLGIELAYPKSWCITPEHDGMDAVDVCVL